MGALPAVSAGAEVTPVPQDAGALVHARAGFAEVDWPIGFYKRECAQEARPGSAPKTPSSQEAQNCCEAMRGGRGGALTCLSAAVGLEATG